MISQKHKRKIIARSQHRTYKKRNTQHKRECKNCGRLFIKQHNRQEYCKGCQPIVQREQHNKAQREYHRRWKSTIKERKLLKPGTTDFSSHRCTTFDKEEEAVRKEIKRIQYPYKKMYSKNIIGF